MRLCLIPTASEGIVEENVAAGLMAFKELVSLFVILSGAKNLAPGLNPNVYRCIMVIHQILRS